MRAIWLILHRRFGLVTALFLFIAGIAGRYKLHYSLHFPEVMLSASIDLQPETDFP
jgi:hypothetical protein